MESSHKKGQIKVFYGDGRGKTTAAMGEVLKAASEGHKVCVLFFIKGKHKGAEYQTLKEIGVSYAVLGRSGFLRGKDAQTTDLDLAHKALVYAKKQISSGDWDLLVLDEINNTPHYGLLSVTDILEILAVRPPQVSIVMTGKIADERVFAQATQIGVFKNNKHPYDKGILARQGIDY